MTYNTKKRIVTNFLSLFLAVSICISFLCFCFFVAEALSLKTEEVDDMNIVSKLSAIPSSDFGGCYYDEI